MKTGFRLSDALGWNDRQLFYIKQREPQARFTLLLCVWGLLPNGLFDEKFDGLCGIFITIFDVYLEDKRKKFYGNYAKTADFWQK
ncbi:MAG: hypothetical protein AAB729_04315 [Patescibacteria group bacterium]